MLSLSRRVFKVCIVFAIGLSLCGEVSFGSVIDPNDSWSIRFEKRHNIAKFREVRLSKEQWKNRHLRIMGFLNEISELKGPHIDHQSLVYWRMNQGKLQVESEPPFLLKPEDLIALPIEVDDFSSEEESLYLYWDLFQFVQSNFQFRYKHQPMGLAEGEYLPAYPRVEMISADHSKVELENSSPEQYSWIKRMAFLTQFEEMAHVAQASQLAYKVSEAYGWETATLQEVFNQIDSLPDMGAEMVFRSLLISESTRQFPDLIKTGPGVALYNSFAEADVYAFMIEKLGDSRVPHFFRENHTFARERVHLHFNRPLPGNPDYGLSLGLSCSGLLGI